MAQALKEYKNLKPFNDAVKAELKALNELVKVMRETDRELVARNFTFVNDNIRELKRQLILVQQELKEQYLAQYQAQSGIRLGGHYYGDNPSEQLEQKLIKESMKQTMKYRKDVKFSLDPKKLEQKHVKYNSLDALTKLLTGAFQQIETIHEVLHNTSENVLVNEYKSIQNYLRDVKSLLETRIFHLPKLIYREQLQYELRKLGYTENFWIYF